MSIHNNATRLIISISIFFVAFSILVGLAGCNLPGPLQSTPALPPPAPSGDQEIPETRVTFYVEIPIDTPVNEPILLSLLDEVTGLALNTRRYPLEKIDETHYSITLPFRLGSILKYRYSRQGEILAEEHTTDGRPVRYRLFHVLAPGEIHDKVARWNDTIYNGPTGRITGKITDTSDMPMAGVLVAAGGAQVFTAGDGSFLIEGLPPGTHNMVVYPLDGGSEVFQQGALVAEGSKTPANIQIESRPMVDITFLVHVPEDTVPIVPLRMAGNLIQLGNTFGDLAGGVNTLATRMPVLTELSNNNYGIILSLPVGADLRYKYTLGDGFWNAERGADGGFALRQLIVPETPTVIEDTIYSWYVGDAREITFDLLVPENTPVGEQISIQFNPYGWTEPIPMWHLGGQRWAYILFSPLDMINQLGYRYCRMGQCSHADDARTPGEFTSGQIVQTSENRLGIPDQIEQWAWFENELPETYVTDTKVPKRGQKFIAGIEFQEFYHPSLDPLIPAALDNVKDDGANWLILNPSWSYSRMSPPVLEPIPGQDSQWSDIFTTIKQAQARDLKVALQPVPRFSTATPEWWAAAPRDFSWWVSWFDNYSAFVMHHADLASQSGAQTLILGGEWISPALPGGTLADGSLSGVPVDANERFQALITEVRERFNGTIAWSLPYPEGLSELPHFLNRVDQLIVLWSAPLAQSPEASAVELQAEAERILTTDIYGLWLTWKPESGEDKPIIINLAYPSANGMLTGCLPDPIAGCLPARTLNYPAPDYPIIELDMKSQARAYDAVLAAVNTQDWIDGIISSGYYLPTVLHDKSTSIHGKPAEGVLRSWYTRFLRK
jgi:hypothetical protein